MVFRGAARISPLYSLTLDSILDSQGVTTMSLATKPSERREQPRFETVQAIYIEVTGRRRQSESSNTILRCETVNVSVGGLKIHVSEPIATGSRLNIGVPLESGKNNLELTGEAVWMKPLDKGDGYWVGLQLDDSDSDTMASWFRVVHSLSSAPTA